MSAIAIFDSAWVRCDHLGAIHAFLAANTTAALQPDEILRAEWAARVSALDLYVHEVIAHKSIEILSKIRPINTRFSQLQIDASSLLLLQSSPAYLSQMDLQIRGKLERRTFQHPDEIAEGIRFISDVELWNEVAMIDGATAASKNIRAKSIKYQLAAIVQRRNKIVHEADLQPTMPRTLWPISTADLKTVRDFVEKTVRAIDAVVS